MSSPCCHMWLATTALAMPQEKGCVTAGKAKTRKGITFNVEWLSEHINTEDGMLLKHRHFFCEDVQWSKRPRPDLRRESVEWWKTRLPKETCQNKRTFTCCGHCVETQLLIESLLQEDHSCMFLLSLGWLWWWWRCVCGGGGCVWWYSNIQKGKYLRLNCFQVKATMRKAQTITTGNCF